MNTLRLALIAGLAVAAAVLATGCGGKNKMTVAEFVKKSHELELKHEATRAPLGIKFEQGTANLAPTDKLPAELTATMTKLQDEEDRFAGELNGIDAPKEAKNIQTEMVAALKADAAYGRKTMDAIGKEATFGELGAAYESDAGVAVDTRRQNACKSMQNLADDSGIKVGWSC